MNGRNVRQWKERRAKTFSISLYKTEGELKGDEKKNVSRRTAHDLGQVFVIEKYFKPSLYQVAELRFSKNYASVINLLDLVSPRWQLRKEKMNEQKGQGKTSSQSDGRIFGLDALFNQKRWGLGEHFMRRWNACLHTWRSGVWAEKFQYSPELLVLIEIRGVKKITFHEVHNKYLAKSDHVQFYKENRFVRLSFFITSILSYLMDYQIKLWKLSRVLFLNGKCSWKWWCLQSFLIMANNCFTVCVKSQ